MGGGFSTHSPRAPLPPPPPPAPPPILLQDHNLESRDLLGQVKSLQATVGGFNESRQYPLIDLFVAGGIFAALLATLVLAVWLLFRGREQSVDKRDSEDLLNDALWVSTPKISRYFVRCSCFSWFWAIMLLAVETAFLSSQIQHLDTQIILRTPAVAIIGTVGVGKSTLCNVVASCLVGRYQMPCAAGSGSESFTDVETEYTFKVGGEPVHWRLRDTPGDLFDELVASKTKLVKAQDTCVQRNCSPNEINKVLADYNDRVKQIIRTYKARNVGTVLIKVSADFFSRYASFQGASWSMDRGSVLHFQLKVVQDLHVQLSRSGIRVFALISHIDKVEPSVSHNPQVVVTSPKVRTIRDTIARRSGIPTNQVYPVLSLGDSARPEKNPAACYLALYATAAALDATQHTSF